MAGKFGVLGLGTEGVGDIGTIGGAGGELGVNGGEGGGDGIGADGETLVIGGCGPDGVTGLAATDSSST